MTKRILQTRTLLLCVMLFTFLSAEQALAQTTLFEDDFSNGNTQDGWVQMTHGASTYGYDGTATIIPAAGNPSSLWHNFADAVLVDGGTLTLSFDVKMSRTTAVGAHIRFGLGYSGAALTDGANTSTPVDGYMSTAPFLGDNADCRNDWLDGDPAGIEWGNAATVAYANGALDDNDNYTINNSEMRTIKYRISRNGEVLSGETYVNGAWSTPVTYTDKIDGFRFNAVGLMASYNAGETFTYDNVKVELFRPPSTVLLEDDFSNGNSRDGWVQMTNGASAYDYGTAGVATIVPAVANPSSLWHNFADTVLVTGGTLTVSFDVKMSRTTAVGAHIRFGLGYSGAALTDGANTTTPVDGYMSSAPFLGDNGDCANYWLDGPINWGNAATTFYPNGALDDNDNYTINNSEMRTIQYRISRNGAVLSGATYVNGAWSASVTYTDNIADFKFNAVGLMATYNAGETFTYDNVEVVVTPPVPPPAGMVFILE
jgi:hypothetical protein